MENASKALIMAGEILIALIILGLWVTLIVTMGSFSADMNDRIAIDKVAEFNKHFTDFEGRIDISVEEIATILNFAKTNNDSRDLSINDAGTTSQSPYWVDVIIDGIEDTNGRIHNNVNAFESNLVIGKSNYSNTSTFKSQLNKFIKNNIDKFFYCNVDVSKYKKPKVSKNNLYNLATNTKGIITINLIDTDIEYSTSRQDKTKLVTKIKFGVLDYGEPAENGTPAKEGTIEYPAGTKEEQKFTVKNDGRNMYTYEYNK